MKIMTYNVQHFQLFNSEDKRIDFSAYADVLNEVDPDILGLNEIRGKGDLVGYENQIFEISKLVKMENSYFAKAIMVEGKAPYGNALLSKSKILKAETIPIPDPNPRRYNGYYETRCLLKARLESGYTVCVLHMGLNEDEQENAVKVVLDNIEDERFILMGDFNTVPNSEVLRPIRERLYDTALSTDESLFTWRTDKPYQKIDYIFTSHDVKVKSITMPGYLNSDHFPLVVEVEDI